MAGVYDLTGRQYPSTMTVELLPGFGVSVMVDGKPTHVEGGPHALPAHIALDLIHTNKARIAQDRDVTARAIPPMPDQVIGPEHRDPDPAAFRTRRR